MYIGSTKMSSHFFSSVQVLLMTYTRGYSSVFILIMQLQYSMKAVKIWFPNNWGKYAYQVIPAKPLIAGMLFLI